MKRLLLLAASALLLSTLVPQEADAQVRRGVRGVGPRGVIVARPGFRPGYVYRYRRRPGWGPAVGLGVLGAAALGAAAAAPYYGYDPCLRRQQVVDVWGNVYWQHVRVC